MSVHLLKALEGIASELETLGTQIERQMLQAIRALSTRDMLLAMRVVQQNSTLLKYREKLEEDCLLTLALYQPVALDLRFIVTVTKVNKDLETVTDAAVTIARHASRLAQGHDYGNIIETKHMAEEVCQMLADAITALIDRNVDDAQGVQLREGAVLRMHRENHKRIEHAIVQEPEQIKAFLQLLSVSGCLQEVGKRSVSISRDILYVVNGSRLTKDSEVNS